MADHMWFVPVTGGHEHALEVASRPGVTGVDNTNVQWDIARYPTYEDPLTEAACTTMSSYTELAMGSTGPPVVESKLTNCFGTWRWRSCTDGQNVIVGGQLAVGTVFSRQLGIWTDNAPNAPSLVGTDLWDTVEAWVKFRLSAANLGRFDNVFFVINDSAGLSIGLNAPPSNWLAPATPIIINQWFVAYAFKTGNWSGWDNDNLRATLSVQGTSVAANVGPVTVDVEWFAFRLSDQG
jgi:hypothetical protein